MIRTQMYLASDQVVWLKRIAKQKKTTMAEISRRAIDHYRQKNQSDYQYPASENAGEFLLKLAENAEIKGHKGPKNLAQNTDRYLYHSKVKK